MLDQWQQMWVEDMPAAMTYVPVQTYASSTAKFDNLEAAYGNYGYLTCPQACEITVK